MILQKTVRFLLSQASNVPQRFWSQNFAGAITLAVGLIRCADSAIRHGFYQRPVRMCSCTA